MRYILSKTNYCLGLQCPLLLYKKANNPEELPKPTPFDQFIFNQGNLVGALAIKEYPGGVMIPGKPWSKAVERTKRAIENKTTSIFEATFIHDEVVVRVDILERVNRNLFNIIEVKQSSHMKEEYIPDVAVQRYVLEGTGLKIDRTYLMHLNKDYIHPNVGDLFVLEDCTQAALEHLKGIEKKIEAQKQIVGMDEPPSIDIGPHCMKPRECPLKDVCWRVVPEVSIFNLPGYRKKWELYESGIVSLEDLPIELGFGEKQEKYIQSFRRNKPLVDLDSIKSRLTLLEEPIFFLDFETINWAVPRFAGCRPYQNIPFQWSLHIMKDGNLQHKEFLWYNKDDPRPELMTDLLDALGDSGSIMVYSNYERGVLNRLKEAFPEKSDLIDSTIERLWDLLDIFRYYYIDWRFKGSNSIKSVLPVLVPDLDYSDLDIKEGGMAMVMYDRMIEMKGDEKEEIKKSLLEYCERDTMAMVEIYKALKNITKY